MIKWFRQGLLDNNSYIIYKDEKAIVIDPTGDVNVLINALDGYELVAIVLTHGHFDHVAGVNKIMDKFNCPIYIHELDMEIAKKETTLSKQFNCEVIDKKYPLLKLIPGKFVIDIFEFEVHHTPGHSSGCVLIEYKDSLFTGDTLFQNSIGRTDLETSNYQDMKESLKYIKSFTKDYKVYPGHSGISTLNTEKENNPFLRRI